MSKLRRGRSHVLVAIALLLGAFLLLSCQPSQPVPLGTPKPAEKAAAATPAKPAEKAVEKAVRGGTLRFVTIRSDDTQDPHMTSAINLRWQTFDALIQEDPDGNITKQGLVKDWTTSADGKAITLKLREGVKFHDGTDFDAAAVKFNIDRIRDPATKSTYRSDYDTVNSVEVVDGLTVRLNLRSPDPILLPAMAAKGGQMVSPAAVKKYGQDFGRNPVGTGPFQFVEWVPDDHITLKRFEGYWRKDKDGNQLPYLEQVVGRVAPDGTVAFANLRTGQVEYLIDMSNEQLAILKGDPNLTYMIRMSSTASGVYLNTKRPPFDNKALRQAVALAVDVEGIAARLGEAATAMTSVLHPITWAYDGKVAQFPRRDLAKAKAKMAEAGFAGGLKAKMPTGNGAEALLTAQIIKANLAEIGLEVEIEALSSAANTQRVRLDMNYGIAPSSMGQGLADPGYLLRLLFHSQGSRNYFGPYGNPQVDQLLDKAGSIYDQKERTALYQQAATIIADDVPFLPMYVSNKVHGMSKKVRNYVQPSDDFPRFHETWLAQ